MKPQHIHKRWMGAKYPIRWDEWHTQAYPHYNAIVLSNVCGFPVASCRMTLRLSNLRLLGYHFSTAESSLAAQSIQHFREHLHQLYEQQRAAPNRTAMLGAYVIRWLRWTQAGLGNLYRAPIPTELAKMVGCGRISIWSNV